MTSPFRSIGLVLFVWACPQAVLAEKKPLELKWGEILPVAGGQRVQMVFPDGTALKGELVTVREDALVMDVKSTSNKEAHPKGSAAIPRASVTLIRVERRRGHWGRSVGTTVGVIAGVVLGGWVAIEATDSVAAGVSTFIGIAAAGTAGGYFAGREIDKEVTMIKIVP
jgi:hypothetical protein